MSTKRARKTLADRFLEDVRAGEFPISEEEQEERELRVQVFGLLSGDSLHVYSDQRVVEAVRDFGGLPGAKADEWPALTTWERVLWLKQTVAALRELASDGGDKTGKGKASAANPVEALLGDDAKRVLAIARTDRLAEERLREIVRLDPHRFTPWTSTQWAKLLGVSGGAVRKMHFWRKERKAWFAKQKDDK
jgi:hypothetical protein